jgi:hypothetical protein
MLGRAIGRKPYSKSYVHELLNGKRPITDRIDRAARILMLGAAALGEERVTDLMPAFDGSPIEKMKAAQKVGIEWQELYARDKEVRELVNTLVDLIIRG